MILPNSASADGAGSAHCAAANAPWKCTTGLTLRDPSKYGQHIAREWLAEPISWSNGTFARIGHNTDPVAESLASLFIASALEAQNSAAQANFPCAPGTYRRLHIPDTRG